MNEGLSHSSFDQDTMNVAAASTPQPWRPGGRRYGIVIRFDVALRQSLYLAEGITRAGRCSG